MLRTCAPIVFPRRRYKDGVPVARQTPDPRLRNRRCKDGAPAVRQTPDPRPLVFPRRRCHAFDCHAFDCGSFQMRHHHILHCARNCWRIEESRGDCESRAVSMGACARVPLLKLLSEFTIVSSHVRSVQCTQKKSNNGGSANHCHRPRRGSWNRVP